MRDRPLPFYPWLDQSRSIGSDIVESGWNALIERLLVDINAVLAGSDAVLVVLQMKEKLGALRFYRRLQGATTDQETRISDLVEASIDESRRTCIVCGSPGQLRYRPGLIEPFCDGHSEDDMR